MYRDLRGLLLRKEIWCIGGIPGSVDGASIFVESAKLKEQVKAMALGAAEKSGEVLRLQRELEDTKMTMAAQHAV